MPDVTEDLAIAFAPYIVIGIVGYILWEKFAAPNLEAASIALDKYSTAAGAA